jgi:hypothetical protein
MTTCYASGSLAIKCLPRVGIFLLSALAGLSDAQADNARFTINPGTFVPGKTYTVTIQDTKCDNTADVGDLSNVRPVASGSGIKITPSDPL